VLGGCALTLRFSRPNTLPDVSSISRVSDPIAVDLCFRSVWTPFAACRMVGCSGPSQWRQLAALLSAFLRKVLTYQASVSIESETLTVGVCLHPVPPFDVRAQVTEEATADVALRLAVD
jgi:hypothetical protein